MTVLSLIENAFDLWLRKHTVARRHGLTPEQCGALLKHHTADFMAELQVALSDAGVKLATVQATPVERPPFTVDDEEVAPRQATSS